MRKLWNALILSAQLACSTAHADYQSGFDAFLRGDMPQALADLRPLAEAGDARAQYAMGIFYSNGVGVETDYVKAAEWFSKSAAQGNADAQYNLGWAYRHGRGVPKDDGKAMRLYEEAAKNGQVSAQYTLGQGLDILGKSEQAAYWYSRAADQGDGEAKNNLATLYFLGRGVPQNFEVALTLFSQAAAQGISIANRNIGQIYWKGFGVLPDISKAMHYYTIAAEKGDANSQYSIGLILYQNGEFARSYAWLTLAAAQKVPGASEDLERLISRMSKEEVDHGNSILDQATRGTN